VDFETFRTIFVGAFGAGAASVAIRGYRNFKARRLQKPAHVRNAGFWTDRRIIRTEVIVCALVLALPWSAVIWITSSNRGLWTIYLLLVAYPFLIWILMRGLRTEFADQGARTDKGP
jgi:hypothetical protein